MCKAHFCKIKVMNYGIFFKNARKESGLTQQIADKMGIRQSNVSDWENDISRPEYEKLVELSKLYRVSVYDLSGVPDNERF